MYQLTLDKYPTGRFGFVGSVPTELAFVWEHQEDLNCALRLGPGFARKQAKANGRVFDTRVWDTREAALAEAARLGVKIA